MWYVWLAVVASCGRWLTTLCAFVCDEGPATRITTPTGRAILVCAPIASLACGTRFIRVSVGALQIGLRYNGVIDNLVILNRQVCVCVCVCVCACVRCRVYILRCWRIMRVRSAVRRRHSDIPRQRAGCIDARFSVLRQVRRWRRLGRLRRSQPALRSVRLPPAFIVFVF
jgi:hypothetical protein